MSFSRITAASVETSKVLETSLTSLARLTRFSNRELRGVLVCHQLHRTFGHEDGGGKVVCLPLHPIVVGPQFPVTLFAAGVHPTLDHRRHGSVEHTRLIGVVGKVAGVEYVMAALVSEGKAVAVLLVFPPAAAYR